MFHAKIIWTTLIACSLIEAHSAHETEKTVGELMLSSGEAAEVGEALYALPPYELTVQFFLFTRSSNDSIQQLTIDDYGGLNQSDFDPEKKTLVLIHGYQSSIKGGHVQDIKNAAQDFHDVNVIAVDWNYFTRNVNYAWVVSMVGGVGTYVGQFLEFLIAHGVKTVDIHLIGHSLGAHVAGFAGKELKANGHTAARITGLDPAFPGFYNLYDSVDRLNSTDAEFVDCIHTCGGKLGFPIPIGQADFFPNGGLDVQPGCTIFDLGTCSHKRSYKYFAESMNPKHLFNAESCNEIAVWAPYDCHDEGALMGYPASPKFKGPLALSTNSEYPFAKNITTV